jgi:hypothetical protein
VCLCVCIEREIYFADFLTIVSIHRASHLTGSPGVSPILTISSRDASGKKCIILQGTHDAWNCLSVCCILCESRSASLLYRT